MAVDMNREADALRQVLARRGLTHLKVTKRGKSLTVLNDSDPEVRLTHLQQGSWRLDFRHHSGRWDETPFTGTLEELVELAESMGRLEDFGPADSWRSEPPR